MAHCITGVADGRYEISAQDAKRYIVTHYELFVK